ncbi:NUDIX hydrolase [Thermoflavimicrobium dichotomicum]|uniref:ADP-ribose pyrophosphatase YjhB, NUDIX family n=1 Tax=Thermoflavimicrobium dichotomicum TaxID=46223 RepID=A0A1I3PCZ8_9BACL|nr:NUDIX domain-containing protein [Thermoflavimicrobium dichotomicum]SFJ19395.1 ADP-ribose pyrophosphatase YjhB, NUDIX family [Thermoflavimicrobium dichotomicum]
MARKDYYHQPGAPKPNSLVPAASAVVTDQEGRIVLHKRSDNHLWSLPGGVMELGESIEQTIIREVKEETGFDVEVLKCIGLYTDPGHVIAFSDGEVRQQFSICFACKILGGEKSVSSESTRVELFTKEEIEQMDLHPAQRIRIQDFFANQERAFIR